MVEIRTPQRNVSDLCVSRVVSSGSMESRLNQLLITRLVSLSDEMKVQKI